MKPQLDPGDAERLIKLLGMLGSDHAGERDAAGLAAHRLLTLRGLAWQEVITPRAVVLPSLAPKPAPTGKWQRVILDCLAHPGSLRRWEKDFLSSLRHYRKISRKQREALQGIGERVLTRRPE